MTKWLTVTNVADNLNLNRKTVYALIDQGELKASYITPRALRVSAESVEALLAKNAA